MSRPTDLRIDPVYPCGICRREVNDNDDAIFCETGCAQWYHRICTGLTELAYDLLTAEENAEWVCDNCIATKSVPLVKLDRKSTRLNSSHMSESRMPSSA